jgi:hypothetical protein
LSERVVRYESRTPVIAKNAKTDQTDFLFNSSSTEAPLSHTRMLTTRRRKQRAKKRLAKMAKQEKRARKQTVNAAASTEVVPTVG